MTAAGAYASFDETKKGRLAPGLLADIVILSKDVFAQPPARFLDAVVDMTILGGKVVYRSEGFGDRFVSDEAWPSPRRSRVRVPNPDVATSGRRRCWRWSRPSSSTARRG